MRNYDMPELGNLLFGHSRGDYRCPRHEGWEELLQTLFAMIARPNEDGYDAEGCYVPYGPEFENDVFAVTPYWWGDCTCGVNQNVDDAEHKPNCKLVQPNFLYKGTGFAISWYKYPLRDAYMNQKMNLETFLAIIAICIDSVRGKDARTRDATRDAEAEAGRSTVS